MLVTVAICTRNRAPALRRALQSVVDMKVPPGTAWELIVVNNASTDDTDAVIEGFAHSLPLRREFEPELGKSNALNHAISAARGDYIIWTDDDVSVDADWLSSYIDAFRRWPDGVLFGGKILPELQQPAPRWLRDNWDLLAGAFALRNFGDGVMPLALEGRRLPFGANAAVRTDEQRAYLYNRNIGPGTTLAGEETDVFEAMLRSGKKGYWVPASKVIHHIPPQRQTLSYVGEFFRTFGRSSAYRERNADVKRLFGIPRWLWRRLIVDALIYRLARLTMMSRVWVVRFVAYSVDLGALEYWLRMDRNMQNRSRARPSPSGPQSH